MLSKIFYLNYTLNLALEMIQMESQKYKEKKLKQKKINIFFIVRDKK